MKKEIEKLGLLTDEISEEGVDFSQIQEEEDAEKQFEHERPQSRHDGDQRGDDSPAFGKCDAGDVPAVFLNIGAELRAEPFDKLLDGTDFRFLAVIRLSGFSGEFRQFAVFWSQNLFLRSDPRRDCIFQMSEDRT